MAGRYVCIWVVTVAMDCAQSEECGSYCRKTYNGVKNYYNATDGKCYSVPVCNSSEVLDVTNNACKSPSDLVPTLLSNSSVSSNSTSLPDKPIQCVHGTLSSSTCICDSGYTTSSHQDAAAPTVLMCDIPDTGDVDVPDGYTLNSDGSLYRTDQVTGTQGFFSQLPWIYVVLIAAVLCVLLCVGMKCCLAWVKYRRHKEKKILKMTYLPTFKSQK